jgi:hypothetical protein
LGIAIIRLDPSRPTRIKLHKLEAPKSFFKAIFIGTPLGKALKRMTLSKAVPDGLKPQECEQGSCHAKLPIPYIPEKGKLQEAVDTTANSIKLTLPGKVELRVSVWLHGTPEQFIMHVQQAINAIKQKGLKETYEKIVGTKKECTSKLEQARLSLEISQGKIKEDSSPSKAVKAAMDVHNKAKEAVLSVMNQVF